MKLFRFLLGCALFPVLSHAAYTVKDGTLISVNEMATLSVQEHYSLLKDAVESESWNDVIEQGKIILKNFPKTPFAQDSAYFIGFAYFQLHELGIANKYFSAYLEQGLSTKFFDKVIHYKFSIAEHFRQGGKRRFFDKESWPKWLPSKEEAIEIYEEVAAAIPQEEMAAKSLYGKAELQFALRDYTESIESFEVLIRRFPKHPLSCEAFIFIAKVYRAQAENEYPDPDYLDLAQLNSKKFGIEFPGHPKQKEIDEIYINMLEVYADELYQTAQFYERTKKPSASLVYYAKILEKYPQTKVAGASQKRLDSLGKKLLPSVPKSAEPVIVEATEDVLDGDVAR